MLTDEAVVWDSLHFGFSWTDNVLCMKWLDSGFGYVSQSAVLTCLALVDVGHDRLLLRAWSLSHAPPAVPVVKQVEHNISNLTKKSRYWLTFTSQRSANRQYLSVPCHWLSTFGRRAVTVAGSAVWNSVPDSLRDPVLYKCTIGIEIYYVYYYYYYYYHHHHYYYYYYWL